MTKWTIAVALSAALGTIATTQAADWTQWRGPDRTDRSVEQGLLDQWPQDGPKRLWLYTDAGKGYSGFSVIGDRLYTMGARGQTEYLMCLNAETGEKIFETEIGGLLENGWGDGPRGTPTYDDGRLYALGGEGGLICADAKTGEVVWRKTMQEFGGAVPKWGYTESPLVDGEKVVVTPGGRRGAMVALNKKTGELIWQAKQFTDGAQYSSIIARDHHGTRQYIQLTMEHVVGIDAQTGKLLWQSDWPGRTAVIPTPIYHDGCVYVTSGYGVGSKLVRIDANNQAEEVYFNKVMKNHHGGVIRVGEHLYGHSDARGWVCQDFKSGEAVWEEERKLGKGAIAYADGKFYLLAESSGELVLIDATPEGWRERGRFTLSPQTKIRAGRGKIWTHPVIAHGRLYLRDQDHIYCFDVRGEGRVGDASGRPGDAGDALRSASVAQDSR